VPCTTGSVESALDNGAPPECHRKLRIYLQHVKSGHRPRGILTTNNAETNVRASTINGRRSTIASIVLLRSQPPPPQVSMSPRNEDRLSLLQGTLDMLILKTLVFGPAHGRGIANYIRQTTENVLSVEQGSLYPALHRLEHAGLVSGKWEVRGDLARELKYYRLTAAGRRHLHREQSQWDHLVGAIGRVMRPARG
jgi:PadR family transcriptional regulator, regulatory protein PadR